MKPKIIVWGNDNTNTLGVLRQLSGVDLDVIFLINNHKTRIASSSQYCKEYHVTNSWEDGIEWLLINFNGVTDKSVLIPCSDDAAEAIDRNLNRLSPYFYLMGCKETGLLTKIDNKNIMCQIASKHGFKIPISAKLTTYDIPEWNVFPAIVKPTVVQGVREFKTAIVKDHKALGRLIRKLNPKSEYQIQELLPKQKDTLVYGVRLNSGEILLAGQYIKDRWSDDGGGSHGLLTAYIPDNLNATGIKSMLEKIDYIGLFSFEYGLIDGEAYFYEVNLRNDGTSHLFYQAGANLPLAWVYDCLERKDCVSSKVTHDVWNINEIYDRINWWRGIISRQQYLTDLKLAKVFHFYDKEDMSPYLHAKLVGYYDVPFRAFLKKFRPLIAHLVNKFVYAKSK